MKKFISKIKKSCHRFMTGKSGFSLVELIVVIAIMAVMAAVLAPALLGYVEKSRMQKDDSAMSEVTSTIHLSLADQNVYDELLQYSVKDNYSCYCDGDTSTNILSNKNILTDNQYWLFNDRARLLDETVYKPAGKMRGVTVTLKPNGSAAYILKDGIINKIGDDTTKKGALAGTILNDCPELYNRLRSTVGDTIKVSSQTYRNSDYTIFISMGTTGGNQADKQDAIKVYGQYNGTNLSEVAPASTIVGESQAGSPAIDVSTVDPVLANNDWVTIQEVIAAGKAQEVGWKVGDTKTINATGRVLTARLNALNRDGNNTATFMITGSVSPLTPMNTTNTNMGGWKDSNMRHWLNTTVYESMTDVKDYIKLVPKLTNNVGKGGDVATVTYDKLWLPSAIEVGLQWYFESPSWNQGYSHIDILLQEGKAYNAATSDGDEHVNANGAYLKWFWLRSPNTENDSFFVYDGGGCHHDEPSTLLKYSILPWFVIG